MNTNKHLLLWSSLGALGLLIVAAVQENFLREWRTVQAAVRTDAGPLDVRLRQIVVPKLNVTDRCVTCHVGMAPGEAVADGHPLAAAAHPPVHHDPAEFGCTTCHGGQGRATDKDDAHGCVPFWPEPMIPRAYAYAGCGSCHAHHEIPSVEQLAHGRNRLEREGCLACHRVDGRGGTFRPGDVGGMEGPDLSAVGMTRIDAQWYERHLLQSQHATHGAWAGTFVPIDAQRREEIEAFLRTRVGAPELVEAKALFHSLGCRGCHKISGVGGDDGPDLTLTGLKDPGQMDFSHVRGEHTLANWLSEHTRDPARVVPDSKMPRFDLTDEQVDRLTYYLLSLRRGGSSESHWPTDRMGVERLGRREFGTDGATLYATFCAGCHGPQGDGRRFPGHHPFPAVANRDFLATARDGFIAATIWMGRPGRRMPAWSENSGGLSLEEVDAIVAHLRAVAGEPEPQKIHASPRWVAADPDRGRALYEQHCASCHGVQGEGTDAPALRHPLLLAIASDDYLVETMLRGRTGTAMHGFGTPSLLYPTLEPADVESIVAYLRTWENAK